MMPSVNMSSDPVLKFREAMIQAGMLPHDVLPDGKLRRCGTQNHPKSRNGWFVLYADPFAGAFGDWASGLSETWSIDGDPLPPEDRRRLWEEMARQRAEREDRQKAEQAEAIAKARSYLSGLVPASNNNPYLVRKEVKACPGLLADGPSLVVPVMGPDGQVVSYQRIEPSGGKLFAPGCPIVGGWFAIKGNTDSPLAICEGIATGISLNQATGFTVLIAFSAGNLAKVARMARERYPDRRIILCADDDRKENHE